MTVYSALKKGKTHRFSPFCCVALPEPWLADAHAGRGATVWF